VPLNHRILLAARPSGPAGPECFSVIEEPAPEPGPGQALVRVEYLSIDPTIRGWMDRDTYLPAIPVGEVIRSGAAGEVVASKHPAYPVGSRAFGLLGWQEYALVGDGAAEAMPLPDGLTLEDALSVYGTTGLTAYFGIFDIGHPEPGETFVVSGAAGGVGSIAGQIAKHVVGCRVIGIAGSPEKCRWVVDDLGFDACIDYKAEDVPARLAELCPDGIDVYFDNVGGPILDAVLAHLALRARIVACGAISQYNDLDHGYGVRNLFALISQRGRMEGFILLDYLDRFLDGVLELATWVQEGKVRSRVDVVEGLEHAPEALDRLFTGANLGKVIVRL